MKEKDGKGKNTNIGMLVWKSQSQPSRQSKSFTTADQIHDILEIARRLKKKGATDIRLVIRFDLMRLNGRRVSMEDKVISDLRDDFQKYGIDETILHF